MNVIKPRSAQLILSYNGVNISSSIADYVTNFSFTDNAGSQADDLSVTLEDRKSLWKNSWYPSKGASLEASIRCENWFAPQAPPIILPCGKFELDEIEMSAGTGDTVMLKGVSALVMNSIRKEKKTRAWENISLSSIAGDIASEHSLTLQFEGNDATYTRIDQREESDLKLLKRLIEDEGNSIKLADKRLIIYSGNDYEAAPIAHTFTRGESDIGSVQLRSKITEIYRACTVKYHDPKDKQLKSFTYTPPNPPPSGEILQINKEVESIAQAQRLAKSRLRSKNKMETTGSISMMGNPRLAATMNIYLAGFGNFSGKYFIDQATHAFTRSGGYTTNSNVHQVLGF
ncbi:phage late control D family protein [Maridesulfovibrio ferrireducens]|uniref:phage late control D family protein n=1 Tax=Maridesulfovibrio ferrireducens TaxID=246191 RepID=UPI001A19652C|nr:contractile injection system protein, VgrG/Pvc8 family [Maridesulfovibrio ferrireducens]MBI9112244.1 hypothetical protein [Maridesulfovibrio ferrireducens]